MLLYFKGNIYRVLPLFLGLLCSLMIGNVYGAEGLGLFAVITSVSFSISSLLRFGTDQFVINDLVSDKYKINFYFSGFFIFIFISFIMCATYFILFISKSYSIKMFFCIWITTNLILFSKFISFVFIKHGLPNLSLFFRESFLVVSRFITFIICLLFFLLNTTFNLLNLYLISTIISAFIIFF